MVSGLRTSPDDFSRISPGDARPMEILEKYNHKVWLGWYAHDKFDIREVKAKISSYETSVEQLGGDSNKLLREREKIMRRYEQKQNELKTFENNMLFFTAKSKSGNSILKEMEKKIANIREELSLIEKKIEVIDSKLQED